MLMSSSTGRATLPSANPNAELCLSLLSNQSWRFTLPDAREDVEHAERKWNAAILSRNHEIAAQHLAPEYRLIIGIEDQPLLVMPREDWLAQLPNYRIHRQQLHDMHVSFSGTWPWPP